MIDNVEELTILVLKTAGRKEAIAVYKEETGCSHAESVQAVESLSRCARRGRKVRIGKRIGVLVGAIVGIGALAFLSTLF